MEKKKKEIWTRPISFVILGNADQQLMLMKFYRLDSDQSSTKIQTIQKEIELQHVHSFPTKKEEEKRDFLNIYI